MGTFPYPAIHHIVPIHRVKSTHKYKISKVEIDPEFHRILHDIFRNRNAYEVTRCILATFELRKKMDKKILKGYFWFLQNKTALTCGGINPKFFALTPVRQKILFSTVGTGKISDFMLRLFDAWGLTKKLEKKQNYRGTLTNFLKEIDRVQKSKNGP